MDEQQVQSIKEQVFGQSTTQSTPPAAEAPATELTTESTTTTETPTTEVSVADTAVVDYNSYIKNEFGFDTVEDAKTQLAELRALKDNIPAPLEFANPESKQVFELLKEGKVKEVKAIYDLQDKLETVDSLTPADAIKLHIEQTNKHFKKADVEDVFEEKYSIPDKPVQGTSEDDDDFAAREDKYKTTVEKINRRVERDAVTAREELAKLKADIRLPSIQNTETEELETLRANATRAQDDIKILTESISKLTEKDISLKLTFNDEANKMNFDISYQGDKDGTTNAKQAAVNYVEFLSKTYYTEDGSPLTEKFANDIYFLQNRDKILMEVAKQSSNETKAWFLRNQKNIGDGTQRNFNTVPPDALAKIREAIFG